jgi:hypothetical protein
LLFATAMTTANRAVILSRSEMRRKDGCNVSAFSGRPRPTGTRQIALMGFRTRRRNGNDFLTGCHETPWAGCGAC